MTVRSFWEFLDKGEPDVLIEDADEGTTWNRRDRIDSGGCGGTVHCDKVGSETRDGNYISDVTLVSAGLRPQAGGRKSENGCDQKQLTHSFPQLPCIAELPTGTP